MDFLNNKGIVGKYLYAQYSTPYNYSKTLLSKRRIQLFLLTAGNFVGISVSEQ